jgi:ABC-type ATPase with predicted acetyltransferase domain
MSTYKIDKRFSTEVERSPRVLEIAEAFGLGLDDKEFVIFDNLELEIKQGDVVYITGQSGSGKSQLLKILADEMTKEGLDVANIDAVEMLDKPIVDQIGKSLNEGMRYMALTGLNDANLYIRKPHELSDGQRYRFRLAKMIESGAKVWIADEFMAVLDRVTALGIAFNMQKIARASGATLLVATTHMDMRNDLAPNLYINKRYREKIEVVQSPEGYKQC